MGLRKQKQKKILIQKKNRWHNQQM